MRLKVKKLAPDAKLPIKATVGSACYDVYSTTRCLLSPMQLGKISTSLAFEVPTGYELEIKPRSGLASKGLIILNSPGTLDSDYRGELLILVGNISSQNILVDKGGRVAQIKLNKVLNIEFEEASELSKTERGEGGFGSTGN